MYESNDKLVSHPDHYISNGLEVIDVIEAFTEGLDGIEASDTANIIKYACRWKRKGGLQDVEKIIWYAMHLKEHLEKTSHMNEASKFFMPVDDGCTWTGSVTDKEFTVCFDDTTTVTFNIEKGE